MWFGGLVARDFILRIYWDGQENPAVECPLPDFFATHWPMQDIHRPARGPFAQLNSLRVAVNPNRGLNCFWEMPFRKHCRITIENLHPKESRVCFYQIKLEIV
jgi:hypothetical protein